LNENCPVYSDLSTTERYNGLFVYNGTVYFCSSFGAVSRGNSYPQSGTDCDGDSVTIYTSSFSFSSSDTAYADICLTTTYTGYFIIGGAIYNYGNGVLISGSNINSYSGTNCDGGSVIIYTVSSSFFDTDTAYANICKTTLYNGYFIYSTSTYLYVSGTASLSDCPTAPSYTNPNILKADIHSSYETGSGAWQTYRANVTGLFVSNSGANRADYRDHLVREFNRKISILNQPTGLFIRPFDNGFRFTGVSVY
jgi:hypothetical protein